MIGQTISPYKITDKLGEGGIAEVYLAEDTSLKRKVALKFLSEYLERDEEARKRFLREGKKLAIILRCSQADSSGVGIETEPCLRPSGRSNPGYAPPVDLVSSSGRPFLWNADIHPTLL